jgi:hypothetical protein
MGVADDGSSDPACSATMSAAWGPHSFRRANITWRQEVGGSSIEASKIAGRTTVRMTEEYTVVQLGRQEELTRRVQEKLIRAKERSAGHFGRASGLGSCSHGFGRLSLISSRIPDTTMSRCEISVCHLERWRWRD